MIHFFTISLVFFASSVHAILYDHNCTVYSDSMGEHVWLPSAISCSNVISDVACAGLYPVSGTIATGNAVPRSTKCYSFTGNEIDQELKDISIATCPKTCGYCCEYVDPAYSCTNAQYPRLNCATITSEQCQSTIWRPIIAQDCPASCGFCNLGGCVDAITDCANDPSICKTVGMQTFVNTYCQLTCGRCASSTTPSSSASSSLSASSTCSSYLADSSKNCPEWAMNGFCKNNFYTIAQRKAYCATTCKLC